MTTINSSRLGTGAILALVLASCSSASNTMISAGTPGAMSGDIGVASSKSFERQKTTTLYVLNLEKTDAVVTIYKNGGATLIRTIDLGPYNASASMAVDSSGKLYASADNYFHAPAILQIFSDRGAKLVRSFKQRFGRPFSYLAFDPAGDLYTTCGNLVCEYVGGRDHLLRRLPKVRGPIATDAGGNVAVAAYEASQLFVYAPGATEPYWKITGGIQHIDELSLTFDDSGNLYAGQFWQPGNVQVYAPGASQPTRTITNGIYAPEAVDVDTTGNLYVLNGGSVTVYPPGGSDPVREITDGIQGDSFGSRYGVGSALAFDAQNNLYVDNSAISGTEHLGSVTVYSPGSDSPVRTITQGIDNPVAIAIGP